MPRKTSFTPDLLTERALEQFWENGFHASSMDDLVKATGVSRHGIYSTFGGKKELFLACFDRYQASVVTPAFQGVETAGAGLADVAEYFELQIQAGDAAGLPGPGCFVANSATEIAPADQDVMDKVREHNNRLRAGFRAALYAQIGTVPEERQQKVENLAELMVIFTNGLWSRSRSVSDANSLRQSVRDFLHLIEGALK